MTEEILKEIIEKKNYIIIQLQSENPDPQEITIIEQEISLLEIQLDGCSNN